MRGWGERVVVGEGGGVWGWDGVVPRGANRSDCLLGWWWWGGRVVVVDEGWRAS